jgi:hypothetical protein
MPRQRRHLVVTAMTVCAACALLASPASADDGKGRSSGGGHGGDDHARVTTTTAAPAQPAQQKDDRGRGNDANRPAANPVPQIVHAEHEAEHEVQHVAAPPVLNLVVDNRGPGNAFGRNDEDNRGPGNARDRDNDDNVANVSTLNDLVNAINNQVATLTNATPRFEIENEDELNEANAVQVEHLRVISLGTLTAGLSAADATSVTNAVNGNTSALQSFLGSGGANSNAIDAALNAIGVAPSSVLTILSDGEHLLVVTA